MKYTAQNGPESTCRSVAKSEKIGHKENRRLILSAEGLKFQIVLMEGTQEGTTRYFVAISE